MSKFISVLLTAVPKAYWEAVQWDTSFDSLHLNPYYTAGVSMALPKHADDTQLGKKSITETSTQLATTAVMVELAEETTNLILAAKNQRPRRAAKAVVAVKAKRQPHEN